MQQCEKFQSEVAFFPCFPVFTRHSYKDNAVCIKQVCKNDNCPVKGDQKLNDQRTKKTKLVLK